MPLTTGARLGAYEILGPLGSGGMGVVFRARDAKLNRDVALKVLPDTFALDANRLARFKREAQVLASLNHPNIATIYGLEEFEGVHALVLELVEGPTLTERLATGPLRLKEALAIATQIADALDAAHERGVIHRDLKPANIILQGAWGPTICHPGTCSTRVAERFSLYHCRGQGRCRTGHGSPHQREILSPNEKALYASARKMPAAT